MFGSKKAVIAAMILVVAVPLAMSEGLGFNAGLDVGFGDVLSGVELSLKPWIKASYAFGEDPSVTLSLKNSNTISLVSPVSLTGGTLTPKVNVALGAFYASVGLPLAYYPAPVALSLFTTAGIAGENWDADVTLDFTVYTPFSWDDVVLYGDYIISSATLSLTATLPSTFDALTLTPWVDVALGDFTVGGGVDVDVGFSPMELTGLTPTISVSYSF